MVTTTQRRQVVTHLLAAFPISARRAMRVIGLSRSRWHYAPVRPLRDAPIRERLKALAQARPRFGYKRLHVLLKREGLVVNHKRVYRLYREERLTVRRHRGRKHVAEPRGPVVRPTQPNERWGMVCKYTQIPALSEQANSRTRVVQFLSWSCASDSWVGVSRRVGPRPEEGAEFAESVAPAVDVQDLDMVEQAVQDRGREDLVVGEDGRPVAHVLVRGEDDAPAFVARGDEPEEEIGFAPV